MISRLKTLITLLVIPQLFFNNLTHSQTFQPYIGIHGGINFTQSILMGNNYEIVTLLRENSFFVIN